MPGKKSCCFFRHDLREGDYDTCVSPTRQMGWSNKAKEQLRTAISLPIGFPHRGSELQIRYQRTKHSFRLSLMTNPCGAVRKDVWLRRIRLLSMIQEDKNAKFSRATNAKSHKRDSIFHRFIGSEKAVEERRNFFASMCKSKCGSCRNVRRFGVPDSVGLVIDNGRELW